MLEEKRRGGGRTNELCLETANHGLKFREAAIDVGRPRWNRRTRANPRGERRRKNKTREEIWASKGINRSNRVVSILTQRLPTAKETDERSLISVG